MCGALAIAALAPGPALAHAQGSAPDAEASVGDATDALPGWVRTRVAVDRPTGFAANASVGYGFTESVAGAPGPHHRVPFSLTVSGQPLRFLGVGLRLDGRGDFHPDDGAGRDRGYVGSGALAVRAAGFVAGGLALGANLSVLALGGDDGFDAGATSLEATALATYVRSGLSLAAELGYRLDRSGETSAQSTTYRPGDRLALGISDFDALLVRAGAGYRSGAIEAFGEVSLDVLLGASAPSLGESPIHAAVGGRYHVSPAFQLEAAADVALASRPPSQNGDPFVVVDPRFQVRLAASYRFGRARGGADGAEPPPPDEPVRATEPDAPPAERTIAGTVRDENGAPVIDARVVVRVGDEEHEGYTDAQGAFRIDGVPGGEGTVEIAATHHATRSVPLGEGVEALDDASLVLRTAQAAGVLRGLVRDFEGRPVRAVVRVSPGGVRARAGEDGRFELELEPGSYTVSVEAPGFRSQSRRVVLSDGQVTIYNVDLRGGR